GGGSENPLRQTDRHLDLPEACLRVRHDDQGVERVGHLPPGLSTQPWVIHHTETEGVRPPTHKRSGEASTRFFDASTQNPRTWRKCDAGRCVICASGWGGRMPPELKRFRDVVSGNGGDALEVGKGPSDPKDAIVPTRGQAEPFHRLAQEPRAT